MSERGGTEYRRDVRERFLAVDTANVADVLDDLGHRGQTLDTGFRPLSGTRLAGWVFTIQGTTVDVPEGKDLLKADACSRVGAEEVTVWAGGSAGACYFGELISVALAERGCMGAVVHGGARDLRWLEQHGFPVFGTDRSPQQSAGRCRVVAYQVDVAVPGASGAPVTVRPGDFVLADEDGVVVVPGSLVDDVLAEAERLTEHEQEIRRALAEGLPLDECLARYGKV